MVLARTTIMMAVALLALSELGRAVMGRWQGCSIDPEDRWVPAAPNSLPARLLDEYERRYTCQDERGSLAAASFAFNSTCTARSFSTPEIQSCFKGRRVIFLGDSLSVQQADSMLGMLGWHADFLKLGDPRCQKSTVLPDGSKVPALYECWRNPVKTAAGCERCYDAFGRDFPPEEEEKSFAEGRTGVGEKPLQPQWGRGSGGHRHRRRTTTTPTLKGHKKVKTKIKNNDTAREGGREGTSGGGVGVVVGREDDEEISVHLRMFSKPTEADWLLSTIGDFNGTRPSDVFVINFGAHFRDTAEGDEDFKRETSRLLDDMARLGDRATVIWREVSPTHFPGQNGSYANYTPSEGDERCCSGTPPPLLERNVWVERYLKEKGLAHRVKLLRIYRMSTLRGSAHHHCHIAPPTVPGGEPPAASKRECLPWKHQKLDCRHWSETGVVEEWNKLMLNHICPP